MYLPLKRIACLQIGVDDGFIARVFLIKESVSEREIKLLIYGHCTKTSL